ncbi:winged helix-turn-helix domain-containing protein [Streptomyces sp. UNOB3_S3]|uniref:GntR family transcriptional regulator n=1 Tax=Streptomyces sp. UNOB3_S3 TaxID=2871682 RepID=UPI001E4BBB01|nr:winged helix-turn-helix domain-containing protein [Streptomyces sp. UNOB3_S3]MCC3773654.1 winged helix-turn-helix domain-containing protein [Streptomyces sp. UNOB3_S3]
MTDRTVDHRSPVPVYQQIARHIIRDIEAGVHEVDRPIPSMPDLKRAYGVAMGTVRKAVEYLVDEGYVFTVPKRGTYVRDRSKTAGDDQAKPE